MKRGPLLLLALATLHWLACSESEPPPCSQRDYTICGSPLGELDELATPWPSFSEDLATICADVSFIEASRGECADGKRVLSRSWGFGGDQRFYAGETLVGRVAGGDVVFVDVDSPQCICGGASFQGTLEGVHCEVTLAERLCGLTGASWIADSTLRFEPFLVPAQCDCRGDP